MDFEMDKLKGQLHMTFKEEPLKGSYENDI